MNEHLRNTKCGRDLTGMLPPGAPKRHQGEFSRVVSGPQGHVPHRIGHGPHCDT